MRRKMAFVLSFTMVFTMLLFANASSSTVEAAIHYPRQVRLELREPDLMMDQWRIRPNHLPVKMEGQWYAPVEALMPFLGFDSAFNSTEGWLQITTEGVLQDAGVSHWAQELNRSFYEKESLSRQIEEIQASIERSPESTPPGDQDDPTRMEMVRMYPLNLSVDGISFNSRERMFVWEDRLYVPLGELADAVYMSYFEQEDLNRLHFSPNPAARSQTWHHVFQALTENQELAKRLEMDLLALQEELDRLEGRSFERSYRYQRTTAEDLARDLRRYLGRYDGLSYQYDAEMMRRDVELWVLTSERRFMNLSPERKQDYLMELRFEVEEFDPTLRADGFMASSKDGEPFFRFSVDRGRFNSHSLMEDLERDFNRYDRRYEGLRFEYVLTEQPDGSIRMRMNGDFSTDDDVWEDVDEDDFRSWVSDLQRRGERVLLKDVSVLIRDEDGRQF